MTKAKLPRQLREKITDLFDQGLTSDEIFSIVIDEAKDYVHSHDELSKCIAGIKGKWTLRVEKGARETTEASAMSKPKKSKDARSKPEIRSRAKAKEFDANKHRETIAQLHERMLGSEFESLCSEIAIDILTNYEGFEKVEKGPDFRGTPFDFFGFRSGVPYIVELKSSLHNFQYPTATQKKRMQALLTRVDGLNIALLQMKLKKGQYRISYNEELDVLFRGKEVSFEPIEKWIEERLEK